jgi:hypothetical protein
VSIRCCSFLPCSGLHPINFRNIYLGEAFNGYVAIKNISSLDIRNLSVKIELQSQTKSFVLAETKTPIENLPPGSTFDLIVHHDTAESGLLFLP